MDVEAPREEDSHCEWDTCLRNTGDGVSSDLRYREETHPRTDEVVHCCPNEVEADLTKDSTRQVERGDNVEEVRLHEHDVGSFHRDIGTRTEGDPYVGSGESW